MKLLLILIAAALIASTALAAEGGPQAPLDPAPQAPKPVFIHQDGARIIDGEGKPIRLRGVNLGGWLLWEGWIWGGGLVSEYHVNERLADLIGKEEAAAFAREARRAFITEADIVKIKQLGFNVVRVPFNHSLLEGEKEPPAGAGKFLDSGWKLLDDVLKWCEKHQIYAVLDLHAAPGGQSRLFMADPDWEGLWASKAKQNRTVALWKAVAGRYKDRHIIAAYDLINEPRPPGGKGLAELYGRIIAAVRSVDKNHMILVEGLDFSRDFSMYEKPLAANMCYSFHMYTWFGDDRAKWLAQYRKLAAIQKVPLWCGEFGENSYDMISSTVAMFDAPANSVSGHCFWTWKKTKSRFPALMLIDAPHAWRRVAAWIELPLDARRPTREEALRGVKGFLEAVAVDKCVLDRRMLEALTR